MTNKDKPIEKQHYKDCCCEECEDKPLSEKGEKHLRIDDSTHHLSYEHKHVKKAVEDAEDFVISMKRDDDKVWNMRLNLIIEEFRKNIFGELK